jgi:hypothetical protein
MPEDHRVPSDGRPQIMGAHNPAIRLVSKEAGVKDQIRDELSPLSLLHPGKAIRELRRDYSVRIEV